MKPEVEQLTVKELIALLEKMPPEAVVWHEGCDCYVKANGVCLQADMEVLITRSN